MNRKTNTMLPRRSFLLGAKCLVSIGGENHRAVFYGFDAGEARVRIAGSEKTLFVAPSSLSHL